MCGRYYIDPDTEDSVERLFHIRPKQRTAGDVTPGMSPLVLHGRSGKMSADAMHWGMTGQNGSMIINARSENIYDRPMFRNSIAEQTQFFGQNRIFSNLSWKVTHILTFIYPFAAVRKMV